MIRTRFAPSPTGDLHVGGAWTALASWAYARANGGKVILRMEDIDTPRVVRGSAERILEDLAWLGLDFDEGAGPGEEDATYTQSRRTTAYVEMLEVLDEKGLVYPCDCSRAEIAKVASAPHAGEELVYPGTCREKPIVRDFKREPAVRLRVFSTTMGFVDGVRGYVEQRLDTSVGDFVLRRGDGVFAYQLAVAIDDAMMGITDVIRADDLLLSTPRQLHLLEELGLAPRAPRYAHVPMVVSPASGERVAKRVREATIRSLRDRGIGPPDIVGTLAHGLGLVPEGAPPSLTPAEVAARLVPQGAWRRTPWPFPIAWT